MACFLRRLLGLCLCISPIVLFVSLVFAEQGGESPRILLFPFKGPGAQGVYNEIFERLEPNLPSLQKISVKLAQTPVRTLLRMKADAALGGRVRCPKKGCFVEVALIKKSGEIWNTAKREGPQEELSAMGADLAEELLQKVGFLHGSGRRRNRDPAFSPDEEDTSGAPAIRGRVSASEFERETEEETDDPVEFSRDSSDRSNREHDFDALEVYFISEFTMIRNLCVDLNTVNANDEGCNLDNPTYDDRAYWIKPFPTLGFQLTFFPGAFAERRRGFSHLGLYFRYGRSILLVSSREFHSPEDPSSGEEPQPFNATIDTMEQQISTGLIYRIPIPFSAPDGPQIRLKAGFSYYEYAFDDSDYPSDDQIHEDYQPSNPYLPTFRYLSLDVGLELRIPIIDMLFPYLSVAYRGALDTGQAGRIYGNDATSHGIDTEVGFIIELGVGIRLLLSAQLIWYSTTFAGQFSPENEMERQLWEDTPLGSRASDFNFRIRAGLGWAY